MPAVHLRPLFSTCFGSVGLALAGSLLGVGLNEFRPHPVRWSGTNVPVIADIREALAPIPGVARELPDAELLEIRRRDACQVVDARSAVEYAAGHLAGAVWLPAEALDASAVERTFRYLVPSRPTIIYCDRNTCPSGSRVARFLIQQGFTRLTIVPGGWRRLSALPLAKEDGPWMD